MSIVKFQVQSMLQCLFGAPTPVISVSKKQAQDQTGDDDPFGKVQDYFQQMWEEGKEAIPQRLTQIALDSKMDELARWVEEWGADGRFAFVRTLQEAARNHGRVDMMKNKMGESVAVKRMPTQWITKGPKEFLKEYASSSERPWYDMSIIKMLNEQGFPHVCRLLGIFRDKDNTFVAMTLAEGGDLFGWCNSGPSPGVEREALMLPIVIQVFQAVRYIHDVGIAHRDLSLENILLSTDRTGKMLIKLIDFGMATLNRICRKELRGKQSYQAPEMHTNEEYDAFLTDVFALGVVVFAMAVQDYPWQATKKNSCQLFEFVRNFGLEKFLTRRKARKSKDNEYLINVISPSFLQLIVGLLSFKPATRLHLGEQCFENSELEGVWNMKWIPEEHRRKESKTATHEVTNI